LIGFLTNRTFKIRTDVAAQFEAVYDDLAISIIDYFNGLFHDELQLLK